MEEDFFDHELKEFVVCMKGKILEVLLHFISFLHAYDRKRGHNMLALILIQGLKAHELITIFLGHENATIIVAKYD